MSELSVPVTAMGRNVRENNVLDSTWGSRGESDEGISGDEFFDFYGSDGQPMITRAGMRAPSEPGLLLFHVVAREHAGPTIAIGASLPTGGPDQVIAIGASRRARHGAAG